MNAREKLNEHYFLGCLAVSIVICLLTQSWTIFVVLLLGSLMAAALAGNIRPPGAKRT